MKTEREARLQSELAGEPDFLRRQELLKTLWHLSQHHDDQTGRAERPSNKSATAAAAARSNRDEPALPRVAV